VPTAFLENLPPPPGISAHVIWGKEKGEEKEIGVKTKEKEETEVKRVK
jgi:hypothetical protein